jgi:cell shape-determining protein MreD
MILPIFITCLAMSIFSVISVRKNENINKIYKKFIYVLNFIQIICIILIPILLAVICILLNTNQSIPFFENDKVFVPYWIMIVLLLSITFITNVIYYMFYLLKRNIKKKCNKM